MNTAVAPDKPFSVVKAADEELAINGVRHCLSPQGSRWCHRVETLVAGCGHISVDLNGSPRVDFGGTNCCGHDSSDWDMKRSATMGSTGRATKQGSR